MVEANAFAFSKTIIEYLAWGVEFAAALIIAIAAARATWQSLRLFAAGEPLPAKVAVRLTRGRWSAVALEFELAADVLNNAFTPTWSDIEKLQADCTRCGGMSGFIEAAALCWAHNIPLSSHCGPSMHLHVCCSVPRRARGVLPRPCPDRAHVL